MLPEYTSPALTVRLFGPLDVQRGGQPLPRLRSRKGQWLLALLVLRAGREVERDWLAALLWPDSSPPRAAQSLRMSLKDLRQALAPEAERLHSPTPRTLSLDLTGAQADVLTFDAALARGDLASLEQAVALYHGPLLEGCAEAWVVQERQVREQAYLAALEQLARAAMAQGDLVRAEGFLRRAVAVDPLRESAQRALMQVLAAGGSYAAAVQVYRELRLALHREINGEPDAETTALYQQLQSEGRQRAHALRSASTTSAAPIVPPGASLPLPRLAGETLTFLFTDIEGSVRHWEEHPEAMSAALARHDALLSQTIEAHEGIVFKTMGDQVCAVFPVPADALAAAFAAQQALQAEPWDEAVQIRVRMALHTGAAEQREHDYYGPPVNRVARLLEAGHGGQVLLSLATRELVQDHLPGGASLQDLGERRLKDLARPEHVFQLVYPDLPQEFPPLNTLDRCPNNLPAQPNPLLGRDSELKALRCLLGRDAGTRGVGGRLVTLTGPGGTGKTRLGVQLAADLLDEFHDGAFFVDLAPLRDPTLVPATIAQVLGVREAEGQPLTESLKAYLRSKQLLLLLDNFEQVVEAAPLVAELLAAAPQLKLLGTSRVALRLRGEQEFPVAPLSADAAFELFAQRARAVRPEFAVTEENTPVLAAICQRLEGLPLAIELAVGRLKLFPPRALLSRLEARLPLLTGGARDLPARQQTLRSAIAWSYDLLQPEEQKLFRRLSVFAGGFSLEAAEAVCSLEGDLKLELLDGLASLIDKSLLRQEAGPDPDTEDTVRFSMLETIREFGQECLAQCGEAEAIRLQHAQFFLKLAESERDRLVRLVGERGNLRAALGWVAESGEAELGFRLAEALIWFWVGYGPISEGREYTARLLALLRTPSLLESRSHTLDSAATLAYQQGDYGAAREFYEESLAICQELGQKDRVGSRYFWLGQIARERGDYEWARTHYERSLVIVRAVGNQTLVARALSGLGWIARMMGDLVQAAALFEESLAVYRELGVKGGRFAETLTELAIVASAQGDRKRVQALVEEGMALCRNDELETAIISIDQGHLLLEGGNYAAARSRFEEGLAARRVVEDTYFIAWALLEAGHAAWLQEDNAAAQSHAVEGLRLFHDLGNRSGMLAALESLAVVALAQGPGTRAAGGERAARLMGGAAALREAQGFVPDWWVRCRERIAEAVRAAALEREWAAAWAEGHAMSLQQAIRYALEE